MKGEVERKEKDREEKGEKEVQDSDLDRFLFGVILALAVVSMIMAGFLALSCGGQSDHVTISGDTVLVITHDEANLDAFYQYLEDRNIPYYVYNVDHPVYYMVYGERNIPLMPPVVFVPTVLCYDGGHLIGTAGYDLNAAERLVAKCYGLEVNG